MKGYLGPLAVGTAVLAGATMIYSGLAQTDCALDGENFQAGRTRNGVAALVAGSAAHQISREAGRDQRIDLTLERAIFPDADIKGEASSRHVNVTNDDYLANTHFGAVGEPLQGSVAKSEYNWSIKQTGEGKYHVGRMLLKADSELRLHAKDGRITGEYAPRFGFNWGIEGRYDRSGNAVIDIDVPWSPWNMTLKGKIGQK